jgi:hypothetical protein
MRSSNELTHWYNCTTTRTDAPQVVRSLVAAKADTTLCTIHEATAADLAASDAIRALVVQPTQQ